MLSHIHIIRHGITEGNMKQLMYSNTDLPLIQQGIDEIAELASHNVYPACENAEYYTSGLLRTEQTLAMIYGKRTHHKVWGLHEMEFGAHENKTFDELNADPEYRQWMADETGEAELPGGESMNGFKRRVIEAFEEVCQEHFARVQAAEASAAASTGAEFSELADTESEEAESSGPETVDTVVVCHGGPISVIMEYCFPEEKEHMFLWMPDPGHGFTIEYEDDKPVRQERF